MWKNYFIVAWRNLSRHRFFTLINILGLCTGLTFLFLIGAYIWGEYTVNNNFPESNRIVQLQSKWKNPDAGVELATVGNLAKILQDNYPSLVEKVYCHDGINTVITVKDKHFRIGLQLGDSTFLDVFKQPLLAGDPRTAMVAPNAVLITANKAKQFFGTTDVLGKTLKIQSFDGNNKDFEITGVLQDLPFNTVTNYYSPGDEVFLGPAALKYFGRYAGFTAWQNPYIVSYVLLKKGVAPEQLNAAISTVLQQYAPGDISSRLKVVPMPLQKWYMKQHNGLALKMVLVFGIVAFFILLMALINFINITIGNSAGRLKEIGVRKAIGGLRSQLIIQLLLESILVAAIASIFSLVLFVVLKPVFGQLTGRVLPGFQSFPIWFIGVPIAILLLTGLLAGIYPAFFLSAQSSVKALKGGTLKIKDRLLLRRGLVTVQFATAMIVFVAAITIQQQVTYFMNKDLGYNRNRLITVKLPRDWTPEGVAHLKLMRDEMRSLSAVKDATFSFELPDGANAGSIMLYKPSADSTSAITNLTFTTDERYLQTYNIKMAAGSFYQGNAADADKIVINEAAARALGWSDPEKAIHQYLRQYNNSMPLQISGVTKDFHPGSLQAAISPVCFLSVYQLNLYNYLTIRLTDGPLSASVKALEDKWQHLFAEQPFEYRFMDDVLASLYEKETQMLRAARLSTVIALLMVVLGITGMTALSITARKKEMGVRKVLGASAFNILSLFMKEFSLVMIIANMIAWPLGWYMLQQWLNGYAYRIELGITPFVAVVMFVVVLVTMIVGGMTRNIIRINAVESLKSE
ncbi:ABC transporter permease [Chitinophaga sp. Cy-1792]|uniref:ABC transporter permease n=1 Tax=Chitinophaga sp. Cy-1792 TaxID=2608339 RepID=UPI00141F7F5B|nr:ABC transporter permease [Chitinophaga sp. Cy-1792]NIG52399.1 FtsX-like permease family protein [Chitinophaga sp. Cy-1792]